MVCDPDKQSGPRRVEVPLFVAPGNGEHAWQCLVRTCGVTVAFNAQEAMMQVVIERCTLFGERGECITVGMTSYSL